MLILTRRVGESIRIGEEVTVTILRIDGEKVRFGNQAPKQIPVHREEIYDRIQLKPAATLDLELCTATPEDSER